MQPLARRSQMFCIEATPDQVCICCEVEFLLTVIENGRHSTLTDAFDALILGAIDLLLHPFSVIVLNLLKPIVKFKKLRVHY